MRYPTPSSTKLSSEGPPGRTKPSSRRSSNGSVSSSKSIHSRKQVLKSRASHYDPPPVCASLRSSSLFIDRLLSIGTYQDTRSTRLYWWRPATRYSRSSPTSFEPRWSGMYSHVGYEPFMIGNWVKLNQYRRRSVWPCFTCANGA